MSCILGGRTQETEAIKLIGQGQHEDHQTAAGELPEDLLADILRRLAPRWLAVSCCVCKAWKATIDDRLLLSRTYGLLPLRLEGIFLYFTNHKFPEFFSRPGTQIGRASCRERV